MATKRSVKKAGVKHNLLSECNNTGIPPQDFMQTFCRRCRNFTCTNAAWADSAWEARMRTQVDRLFEDRIEANPDDPQYERIREAEFPSLLREAIRLNLAEARGDWSVPSDADVSQKMRVKADEIHYAPPKEELPDEATSVKIDDALEALTGKRPVRQQPSGFVATPEADSSEPSPSGEEFEHMPDTQPTVAAVDPSPYNAPSQSGTVIGGPPPEPVDPWAVPKKPANVVEVGSTIRMTNKK